MKYTIRRGNKKRDGRHRWIVTEAQVDYWTATYVCPTFRDALTVVSRLQTSTLIPADCVLHMDIREWRR